MSHTLVDVNMPPLQALVSLIVGSSVKHGPIFVISEPTEAGVSVVHDRHGEGCVMVAILDSIKRGWIFAISRTTEDAGVSVPDRLSDAKVCLITNALGTTFHTKEFLTPH